MIHTLRFCPLEKHLFASFVFGPTHASCLEAPERAREASIKGIPWKRGSAGGRPGKSGAAVGQ